MKAHWNHREAPHWIPDKHPAFHHGHGLHLSAKPAAQSSSCQQPWPGSLPQFCSGKHIFKIPWFWDQPGNVLAGGGGTQKSGIILPCARSEELQRHHSDQHTADAIFSPESRHKVFFLKGMAQVLVLLLCRVVTQEPGELPVQSLRGERERETPWFWARCFFGFFFFFPHIFL